MSKEREREMLDVRRVDIDGMWRWYLRVPGGPNAWNVADQTIAMGCRTFRTREEAIADADYVLGRSVERYSKCMEEARAARARRNAVVS